jgi:hypothetical protein
MNRKIITITDKGAVAVPVGVRMTVCEIADTFGVFYQTVKRYIRDIQKAGIADGDYKMTCIVDGANVHPEYYGLEMIAAVAFRVSSWQANILRRWLMERATAMTTPPIMVWEIPRPDAMPN